MLICLCLLISIGYTLRVPLPEFLEKLFDDGDNRGAETERQSAAAATSKEAILSAFVGTFLYTFVRKLLVLYDEHVINTATTGMFSLDGNKHVYLNKYSVKKQESC